MTIRILVLGLNGFVGKHLQRTIDGSRDYQLVIPDHQDLRFDSAERISEEIAMSKVNAVINLAAVTELNPIEVGELFEANAFGPLRLLRALKQQRFRGRFIQISSGYVYGMRSKVTVVDEDTITTPQNLYGCSKVLGEHFCRIYSDGIDINIVRPFNLTGIGQDKQFFIPKIVEAFKNKYNEIEVGSITSKRDYSDVRDFCCFLLKLSKMKENPKVINFCSGQLISLKEIINLVSQITGHTVKININNSLIRNDDISPLSLTSRLSACRFTPKFKLRETLEWMIEKSEKDHEV